jgi:F420-non-reducing hydrogenase iron-sulfur subunit
MIKGESLFLALIIFHSFFMICVNYIASKFNPLQCMYAAADLCSTMELQYDVSSGIIRMPCTARLDINFILKALQEGADGVLIIGCHPGDCAYKTGNLRAERRVRFARKLIGQLGFNEGRVKMVFVSAAEGDKLAADINQFAEEIRKIGPNPIRL